MEHGGEILLYEFPFVLPSDLQKLWIQFTVSCSEFLYGLGLVFSLLAIHYFKQRKVEFDFRSYYMHFFKIRIDRIIFNLFSTQYSWCESSSVAYRFPFEDIPLSYVGTSSLFLEGLTLQQWRTQDFCIPVKSLKFTTRNMSHRD